MEILSPFAGKIVKVGIKAGAKISEDEETFVIEAMKMETPVYAPSSGTVKEVKVSEGQDVEADAVLAIIE